MEHLNFLLFSFAAIFSPEVQTALVTIGVSMAARFVPVPSSARSPWMGAAYAGLQFLLANWDKSKQAKNNVRDNIANSASFDSNQQ